MERETARRMIEVLRSGVATPEVAVLLPMGRERFMAGVAEDMDAIARRDSRARHLRALVADYGEGKTHTLNAIRHLAEEERFLVTEIAVSRETTLERPDRLYRKLIQRTYFPGVTRPGLAALLKEIEGRPEALLDLLTSIEDLHPKVRAILTARFRGRGEDTDLLDGDLEGFFLNLAETRRIYRERLGQKLSLERFRQADSLDYIRLLDRLSVAAGLSGWVLLLDEVEMIGRLGRLGRARSYAFLADLLNGSAYPHTYAVLALAKSFRSDVLEKREEGIRLLEWLEGRGDVDLALRIRPVLDFLGQAPMLPPLRDQDLAEAFAVIIEAHALSYRWQCPLSGEELLKRLRRRLPEADVKVRQLIRSAVQFLDLYQLYGEEPDLRLEALMEPVAYEDQEEDEPPEGEGAVRDWPF
jgi:hypothetical protein